MGRRICGQEPPRTTNCLRHVLEGLTDHSFKQAERLLSWAVAALLPTLLLNAGIRMPVPVALPALNRFDTAAQPTAHCRTFGLTVILSEGDVVFQPRKIQRSGLWDAVDDRVLIYIHKERMLEDRQHRYPARRYVMIDDKLRILAAVKESLQDRLISGFPRQGNYALGADNIAAYPAADLTIERIGGLARYNLSTLLDAAVYEPAKTQRS
jgi:hypothetical protein